MSNPCLNHPDVHIFLDRLEKLVDRIHKKRKKYWYHDLINTVTIPTRVTSSSESFIDVMVTNRQFNKNYIKIVNMGFSDHLAQILWVDTDKRKQ
jgi:hypothetical protein